MAGVPSNRRRCREAVRAAILKIETGSTDPLPGLSEDAKRDKLSRLSYADYLTTILKADKGVLPYYQHRTDDLWGCGIDAISALDCWGVDLPGFAGLKLTKGGTTKRMGYTPAGYSRDRRLLHFPLSRRQCLHRAAAGARPDPRQHRRP